MGVIPSPSWISGSCPCHRTTLECSRGISINVRTYGTELRTIYRGWQGSEPRKVTNWDLCVTSPLIVPVWLPVRQPGIHLSKLPFWRLLWGLWWLTWPVDLFLPETANPPAQFKGDTNFLSWIRSPGHDQALTYSLWKLLSELTRELLPRMFSRPPFYTYLLISLLFPNPLRGVMSQTADQKAGEALGLPLSYLAITFFRLFTCSSYCKTLELELGHATLLLQPLQERFVSQ